MVEKEAASVTLRYEIVQKSGPGFPDMTVCVHGENQRYRGRCIAEGVEQIVFEHTVVRPEAIPHHIGEACLRRFQPLAFVKNLDMTVHARLVL